MNALHLVRAVGQLNSASLNARKGDLPKSHYFMNGVAGGDFSSI